MPHARKRRFGARCSVARSQSESRRSLDLAARCGCEPLEKRVLLSTINWTNKGTAMVDSDNFNATYGGNSTVARAIVQRAIDDWERVIVDFNYAGGGNTFSVEIDAAPISGRGVTFNLTADAAGKMTSADITMDDNGGGLGWYFDPVIGSATVPDDGEFTNLSSPFEASFTGVGGANDDDDFYRTIAHELGHALGIFVNNGGIIAGVPAILGFLTDTNIDDPLDTGTATLQNFNVGGGAVEATLTENGGGHFWEAAPQGGGTLSHPNDLLNPGRSVDAPPTIRQLISDLDATVLQQAYGYTIALPSTINTFYANLNTTTNVITVTGDANPNGDNADVIDLEVDGTAMSFEVNGTDEVIEGAQFTTIVVNAGLDADDIDVDELLASKTLTVNGDAGNDNISAAQELQDIDTDLDSDFTANGGADTDTLVFNDQADTAGGDDYTLTNTTFVKNAGFINRIITFGTFENLTVNGSPQASTYDINTLSSAVTGVVTINAGAAADTITVGGTVGDIDSGINADLTIHGNGGTDNLIFNDVNDDAGVDDSYTLTSIGFDKSSTTEVIGFDTVENLTLTAGLADNTINVLSASGISTDLLTLLVNGNDGNDTINMGSGDLEIDLAFVAVTVNGQAGADALDLDDSDDAEGNDDYTITDTTFDKNTAGLNLVTFGTVEDVSVDGSAQDNTFTIEGFLSTVDLVLHGNSGADTFQQAFADMNLHWNGDLQINGGNGSDTINLDDSGDATADAYTISNTTFQVSAGDTTNPFVYGTVETFTWLTNDQGTPINIPSTMVGTTYTINAADGDDTFNVGSPGNNTDGIDGLISLNGQVGTDAYNYNDSANAAAQTYTVSLNNVLRSGTAGTIYNTMETLTVNCGTQGDTINVASVLATTPATVNGNGGNDSMIASTTGDWDLFILGNLTYNGGAGTNDLLRINDTGDAGADNYTVNSGSTTKSSIASVITYATIENYTLDANDAVNTVTVNSSFAAPFRVHGNGGADTVNLVSNAAGSFVTIDDGTGLDFINVNSDGAGVATAHFDSSQDLASLTILAGGTAVMETNGARLIDTDALTVAATGLLDLTDNDLLLDYAGGSQLPVIQALLNLARNDGAWNGFGITSSAAASNPDGNTTLGAMEATEYDAIHGAGALFDGVDPDATAVLVKYTYYGDTDFNGFLDGDDYSRADNGFNTGLGGWTNGDSTGNGVVDGDDYALIDNAFNTQSGTL
jgi:hypothetical protein